MGPGRAFLRGMDLTLLTTTHLGRTLLSSVRKMEGDNKNLIFLAANRYMSTPATGKTGRRSGNQQRNCFAFESSKQTRDRSGRLTSGVTVLR